MVSSLSHCSMLSISDPNTNNVVAISPKFSNRNFIYIHFQFNFLSLNMCTANDTKGSKTSYFLPFKTDRFYISIKIFGISLLLVKCGIIFVCVG